MNNKKKWHLAGLIMPAFLLLITGITSAAVGTWKAPLLVAATDEDANWPEMAIDAGGTLHVAWHEAPFLGDGDIYYVSRAPGGPWSAPTNISHRPTTPSEYVDIAVDGSGVVHVVWDDGSYDGQEIYYAAKSGNVWSQPVNVSNTSHSSFFPSVAVSDGGDVYVLWEEYAGTGAVYNIYFAEKPAGGNWLPPVNVSNSTSDANDPQLIVDGDNLYLMYWDDKPNPGSDYDVYYTERLAGSANWSVPVNVSNSSNWSTDARMVLDANGILHAVWDEGPGFGAGDIVYARKPAGGNWSSFENVSNSSGDANDPTLLVGDDGVVHVAYYDWTPGQADIFYTSRDAGNNWSPPQNISQTPNTAQDFTATLLWADGALHLLWDSVAIFGNSGVTIYEVVLGPGGWSSPAALTPVRYGSVERAQSVVDGTGAIQVVYAGKPTGGVFDIYHLRNDGPPPTAPINVLFAPNGGGGQVGAPQNLFTATYDANGGGNVRRAFFWLNTQPTPANGLGLLYDAGQNQLILLNEAGTGVAGICQPGDTATLSHSYAQVDCAHSQVSAYGENVLLIQWRVTFTSCPPGGCGTYQAWLRAQDFDNLSSGLNARGVWTLQP
ncbi:MAG: exo-alpha-sialidase [Anaerolineales bacterium]|nr:exo-alpha-sialidase [Anaerolineales bacterium]MCB8953935.1 exo-alpha-sialidase [Ardenticatenales bacterium]